MGTSWFTLQSKWATKKQLATSVRPRIEVLEDRIALATRVWDGNSLSNNWSNAFNWANDIAPVAGDDIVFPAGNFNDNKVADNNYPQGTMFRSITFQGGGFNVKGNRIVLGSGGIVDNGGSSNALKLDVTLGSPTLIYVGSGSNLFFSGNVSGLSTSYTLTKSGPGNLSMEGNNSYIGKTIISQGQFFHRNENALGTAGEGTVVKSGARLRIEDKEIVGGTNINDSITVERGGKLDTNDKINLNGKLSFAHNTTISMKGNTTINGEAEFSEATQSPFLNTTSVLLTVEGTLTFKNTVSLLGGRTDIHEGELSALNNVIFEEIIQGQGGLDINVGGGGSIGTHGVKFNGNQNNTYQGGTKVFRFGVLIANKSNGKIAIPAGPLVIGGDVQINGHQQISHEADVAVASSDRFSGLNLNGFDNTIASLEILGWGQVFSTGVLRQSQLKVTGSILGTDLNAPEQPTFSNGFVGYPTPGIRTDLLLLSGTQSIKVEDDLLEISGKIMGATTQAGILKTGAGKLLLSGNSDYQGNTFVQEGILQVDGNNSNSKVIVNGGRLVGHGEVGGLTVNAGGRVKPGSISGFGILKVAGDVNFLPGSFLDVKLNNPIAGSGYDQIVVNGSGSSGQGSGIVQFNGAILTPTVGLGNAIGDTFRIIDNDDSDVPIGETFASSTQASVPQGAALVAPTGERFTVNYKGSIGNNDVVLTRTTAGALFPNRSVTPQIVEGGVVTLTGIVSDPDRKDTFILHINWGDGSSVETKVFGPTFNGKQVFLRHRYLTSQAEPYVIQLNWHDQRGAGNSGTLTTLVTASARATSATDAIFASLLNLKGKSRLNFLAS